MECINDLLSTGEVTLGLCPQALKPDSLDSDPRSRFNVISRELHTVRRLRALHCWTGVLVYCHTAQIRIEHCYAAQIWIEAVWRQSGLWIRIPDLHRIWIQGPVWRDPVRWSMKTTTIHVFRDHSQTLVGGLMQKGGPLTFWKSLKKTMLILTPQN